MTLREFLIIGALVVIGLSARAQSASVQDLISDWEKRAGVTPQKTTEVAKEPSPLCKDPTFDAIVFTKDGELYIFKGEHFYQVTPFESVGDERSIEGVWPYLPNNIEAAETLRNGLTYFFKNGYYWSYDTQNKDSPRLTKSKVIGDVFPTIAGSVDAVECAKPSSSECTIYAGSSRTQMRSLTDNPTDLEQGVNLYEEGVQRSNERQVMSVLNLGEDMPPLIFYPDGTYNEGGSEDDKPISLFLGCNK